MILLPCERWGGGSGYSHPGGNGQSLETGGMVLLMWGSVLVIHTRGTPKALKLERFLFLVQGGFLITPGGYLRNGL